MKQLITLITILFISLLSSPSWSATVSVDELVTNPSDGRINQEGIFKNNKNIYSQEINS